MWRKRYYQEMKKGANLEQLLRKARGNTDKLSSLLDERRGHLRSIAGSSLMCTNKKSFFLTGSVLLKGLQGPAKLKPSEKVMEEL